VASINVRGSRILAWSVPGRKSGVQRLRTRESRVWSCAKLGTSIFPSESIQLRRFTGAEKYALRATTAGYASEFSLGYAPFAG
jgi:hypothetical protein